MLDADAKNVLLFSYGTLQDKAVQLANFGRELGGSKDVMVGYVESEIEITDPAVIAASGKTHHPIVRSTGLFSDQIHGTVFAITQRELQAADAYEVADYKRVKAPLKSGKCAWVYVSA